VRSFQLASLRVALHVTKRRRDSQATHRLGVTGGTLVTTTSQEARGSEVYVLREGPSSSPGYCGKADNRRVGQLIGRDAEARAMLKGGEAIPRRRKAWRRVTAAILAWCVGIWGFADMGIERIGLIRISAAVEVSISASLRVALHVTKRHSDSQATHRLGVTGGTLVTTTSQEARGSEVYVLRRRASPGARHLRAGS